jgi:acyl-CoA thioesterase-1
MSDRLRYVALGDSYTIGTSVAAEQAFPTLLAGAVPALELVANLGVNGYSTVDLIREELPAFARADPGFATLLIGVNDAVQGIPTERYATNVTTILEALVAGLPRDRIVVVTVPDYTVTPAGADYGDPAERSAGIRANNATMSRLAAERGIVLVDIHDISLEAATDPTLVADDGLHPSGVQYRRWVERIAPVVGDLLESG